MCRLLFSEFSDGILPSTMLLSNLEMIFSTKKDVSGLYVNIMSFYKTWTLWIFISTGTPGTNKHLTFSGGHFSILVKTYIF